MNQILAFVSVLRSIYNDDLPNIPNELINKTSKTYEMF